MANSKLHDDLVNEIEPNENVKASIAALAEALADRIDACNGDPVKLTDLKTILREDPGKVAKAVLANTPAARIKSRTTSDIGAPSSAFERPREGVRPGMLIETDHRDQQFPATSQTEPEKERIKREQTARDRGFDVMVQEQMPEVPAVDRKIDDDAKRKTEKLQHGKR